MTKTAKDHGAWRELSTNFDDAVAKLPSALQAEGFGVITQIDLQDTFKTKLGVSFRRYRIFGACNPAFALKAVTASPQVGVLLPCNVVLYEQDDGGCMMGVIDPMQTLGTDASLAELQGLASEVTEKLHRVLATMATAPRRDTL